MHTDLSNQSAHTTRSPIARFGQSTATLGLALYAAFAPHSIAAAEISLLIVGIGWLLRTIATSKTGLIHTRLDLPIWLFLLWTVTSSLLSTEPRISIAKLQSTCVVFLFYLTQAVVSRRTAVLLVCVMIASGVAGTAYSFYDLLRGRGVVVESISNISPFRETEIQPNDTIWRLGGQRVYSKQEIDDLIKRTDEGTRLAVSVISHGEHVERPGFLVNSHLKSLADPSGITGSQRNHYFRASGFTR